MSAKEIDKHEIIRRLIRREINGTGAARLLRLSIRHVRRLKKKVERDGAKGLVHGSRGKHSHNQLPKKEREKIVALLRKHYPDFGPTFAAEKLKERHRINRDPKTIRQIMADKGLWRPRAKKKQKEHRTWRERKSAYGEMIQFDGSYEHWFEGRGNTGEVCLLAAIDDATGRVTHAEFSKHEGVFPVFTFWKEYLQKNGTPRSIYLDKFSTYHMNHALAKENPDTLTQFQRAMEKLRVEVIPANSPEAKGRVERLFQTLQDRLIKELRLVRISTIQEANVFLKTYLPTFNARFSVEPRSQANLHRLLPTKEQDALNGVLSRQIERTIQNDFTMSFHNQWYQMIKDQPVTVCKKDKVIVEERIDGTIHVRLRGKYLNYTILPARPQKTVKALPWILHKTSKQSWPQKAHTPPSNHPWRQAIGHPPRNRQTVQVGHFNFLETRTF